MRSQQLDSVVPPELMQRLVRRECARADRNGEQFSLVLFAVGAHRRWHDRSAYRLARVMLERARQTDDIGWYGQQHVAALLTDTTPEGARAFADKVAAGMKEHGVCPTPLIYHYPSDKGILPDSGEAPAHAPRSAPRGMAAAAQSQPLDPLLAYPAPPWKRVFDIVGASILLVLLAPVLAAAAAAIKLTSPGPVFFLQRRTGRGGAAFTIYKLRTMIVNAEQRQQELRKLNEQDGPAFKLTHDPRVTRVGAFLRKTSIDELPQLINVLKGDMSLVGPRPLPIKEQEGVEQWQRHRLNVLPGLTCIWQVKGRSQVSFADWVRMDVEYIRRQTIWHDLQILFSTVPSVLLRRGAR